MSDAFEIQLSAETQLIAVLVARHRRETLSQLFTRLIVEDGERIGVKALADVRRDLLGAAVPMSCRVPASAAPTDETFHD